VGSPAVIKSFGDAYQNEMATNTDFDPNGYFYSVTLSRSVTNLRIEAFDPAMIAVGDFCEKNNLVNAKNLPAADTVVPDPLTRYKELAGPYCTGDNRHGGTGQASVQFTVRSPGPNPWNALSFPPIGGTCTQTFAGFTGDLAIALDKTNAGFNPVVAANFRQWKTLCTVTNAQPGTYLIQVKTNGLGNDAAAGSNRFSLRAYGSSSAENDAIAVSGFTKMAMYANTPTGITRFFLAKVPSSAKGKVLDIRIWDIGDNAASGSSTVTVLPPTETGGTFSGCTGAGVENGALTNCRVDVDSTFNGKWQSISVPIPATYTCSDASFTGCWVRMETNVGGSSVEDNTSLTASLEGDPVRLVQ
jgi:hypothetical protein